MPYLEVSTKELADDFDNNAVAAKAKWNDKPVQFTGKIANITESGLLFSDLGATKQFSLTSINCRVTKREQMLTLQNGQVVTIRGIINGQTLTLIDIGRCEVVN